MISANLVEVAQLTDFPAISSFLTGQQDSKLVICGLCFFSYTENAQSFKELLNSLLLFY